MVGLRGAVAPEAGLFKRAAAEIARDPARRGRRGHAARRRPRRAADARRARRRGRSRSATASRSCSTRARSSPTDEIMLLNTACAMVDGAYQLIAERLKPGSARASSWPTSPRPCSTWAPSTSTTSTPSPASAARPHPHVFSDRLIRPGDQAFFDIIQTFVGYKTCYYRTFVGRHGERRAARRVQAGARVDRRLDRADDARARDRRGREGLAEGARSSASRTRWSASGSSSATASACSCTSARSSAGSTRSTIPVEIKEGMVIALETYCPAKDGYSRGADRGGSRRHGATGRRSSPASRRHELFVANAY